MRKVLFEQIGNMIVETLFIIAACQTVVASTFSTADKSFSINVTFPFSWLIFLLAILFFSIARKLYEKKIGAADGYTQKEGELSAQDEREKIVGLEASKTTYRILLVYLAFVLLFFLFGNGFITSAITLRIMTILLFGSCLVFAFLTYLISWIVYDHRM